MYLVIVDRGKNFKRPRTFERHINTIIKRHNGERIVRSVFKFESIKPLLEVCELVNEHNAKDFIVYDTDDRLIFSQFASLKSPLNELNEKIKYVLKNGKILNKEDYEKHTEKSVKKFLNWGKKHQES